MSNSPVSEPGKPAINESGSEELSAPNESAETRFGDSPRESPGVVPEAVRSERPEEEPAVEEREGAAAEGQEANIGCSIRMGLFGSARCGRRIHVAPASVDEFPVCLMHSNDPAKQSGALCEVFWIEFHQTLEKASDGEAYFERFVFPELKFAQKKLRPICQFRLAKFTQEADFSTATFKQGASFLGATFVDSANFTGANFSQNADFDNVTFLRDARFSFAKFECAAEFGGARFEQEVSFSGTTFSESADFQRARFSGVADFNSATVMKDAIFSGSIFWQDVTFWKATFAQKVDFEGAEFQGTANWTKSQFLGSGEFRHTKFEPLLEGVPGAVFAQASISKPSEIVFDDVDLSRVVFHSLDVSEVWFTSSVRWGKRGGKSGYRVFEEMIDLEQEFGRALKRDGCRDYRGIEMIYQQLKKNYDSRLDYKTGNEFHFAEMEMRRLAELPNGRLLKLRQWRHSRLSLVAFYRLFSNYGNNYVKPVCWLLVTVILAAVLFPTFGLVEKQQYSKTPETYKGVWYANDTWTNNFWNEAKLIGKSAIAAVDDATFQRSPEYTPVYPWGRVVAILETLLTSTLLGLFLLAIRRQFRR